MSTRQHHVRDIVAEGQFARLLASEPASLVKYTPSPTLPSFPPDARAVIYRPSRSVMTSGRANTCNWVLEFEPRSAQCPAGNPPEGPEYAALHGDPLFCFAWDRPYLVMPDLDMALLDPARVFTNPREVATHPLLTMEEKCEVLARWLWDARRIEATAEEAPLDGGEASRIDARKRSGVVAIRSTSMY